jgi:hypothetical protein
MGLERVKIIRKSGSQNQFPVNSRKKQEIGNDQSKRNETEKNNDNATGMWVDRISD